MKIAKGLDVLNIPNPFNPMYIIYPTLLYDKNDIILFDTGYPGNFNNIHIGLINSGLSLENLTKIIITNQDFDHIGALSSLVRNHQSFEIYSHVEEKPYIEGKITPVKMTEEFISKIHFQLPQFTKKRQDEITDILNNYHVQVDKIVNDKEELPFCGGIKVIFTPGPTPGHTCYYLKKYKTLVAGDLLNIYEGELYGPEKNNVFDMKQSVLSIKPLMDLDIQKVISYHSGVYEKNANKRIKQIFENELKELQL